MYNIFVNEHKLILSASPIESSNVSSFRYLEKVKFMYPYIDRLEKTPMHVEADVCLYHTDISFLWSHFKEVYTPILAAGGVVRDANNLVLGIFRNDWWDLPKGKIDPGESKEVAALREVKEETNVQAEIEMELPSTYHTYRTKKHGRILKRTFWFAMNAEDSAEVVVQEEEGIDAFDWQHPKTLQQKRPMYRSIQSVLANYIDIY